MPPGSLLATLRLLPVLPLLLLLPLALGLARSDVASIDGCDLPGAVCSAGAVGHFEGDVTSAAALRQAVRACSHKRELVLLAAGDQRWAVLDALNLIDNLRVLRIAHVLLLVPGKRVCDHVRRFAPDTCCVWSSEPLRIRGGAGKKAVFVRRLRLLARVLALPPALRVNVLFVDSDIVVATNPYPYFSQPPLAQQHAILLARAAFFNIGVVRLQNLAPDGAVAWAVADALDRYLRYGEAADDWFRNQTLSFGPRGESSAQSTSNLLNDQALLSDSLFTAIAGEPFFMHGIFHRDAGLRALNAEHLERAMAAARRVDAASLGGGSGGGGVRAAAAAAAALAALACSDAVAVESYAATVPTFKDGKWRARSGEPFPPRRGAYSSAWLEQRAVDAAAAGGGANGTTTVTAAAAATATWPNPYDPPSAAAPVAAAAAVERVAFAPSWLFGYWSESHSFASPGTTWWPGAQPPTHVIGHILGGGHAGNKRVFKPLVKQAGGYFNFTTARALGAEFLGGTRNAPTPPVLALTPAAAAALPAEPAALRAAAHALAQLAAAARRGVAWPAMPCAAFADSGDGAAATVFVSGPRVLAQRACVAAAAKPSDEDATAGGGGIIDGVADARRVRALPDNPPSALGRMRCVRTTLLGGGCVRQGVGLLPTEFEALLRRRGAAAPSPSNTLAVSRLLLSPRAACADDGGGGGGDDSGAASGGLPCVALAPLLAALDALSVESSSGGGGGNANASSPVVLYVDALALVAELEPLRAKGDGGNASAVDPEADVVGRLTAARLPAAAAEAAIRYARAVRECKLLHPSWSGDDDDGGGDGGGGGGGGGDGGGDGGAAAVRQRSSPPSSALAAGVRTVVTCMADGACAARASLGVAAALAAALLLSLHMCSRGRRRHHAAA